MFKITVPWCSHAFIFSSSSKLETTPINVAIHASQVFPEEADFYQQKQSGSQGGTNPAEYRIQYSQDFQNLQGRNQEEQEQLFVVDVDGLEATSGDDIEDYIESVYNENDLERSSVYNNYNENYDDENTFGGEWDIMMEDYESDVDTSQDFTDQYQAASTSHPVTLQVEERDDGGFGQEWDIMEEYVDEDLAPTPSHVQDLLDYNLAETQYDITDPRLSEFGQQWDLESYYPAPDPQFNPEVQVVEVGAGLQVAENFGQEMVERNNLPLIEVEQADPYRDYREDISTEGDRVSSEPGLVNQGDFNQQMEDYPYYDNNQHLAFNTGIVPADQQEENPYYNASPVMVHEHLALAEDYSGFIPNMSTEDETKHHAGMLNEEDRNTLDYNDHLSEESESLTEVESNHINISHQEEEEDQMSRNTNTDILSELEETESTTSSEAITTTLQPVPVSSSSPESTDTTEADTTVMTETETVLTDTTTPMIATETEETTTIPDTTTLPSQTERDISLPYNIEALNLVSMDRLNLERDDSMVTPLLPFPEPLAEKRPTARVAREELYSLPAGHGLRFRFKIDQLNQYIPNFGFMTE